MALLSKQDLESIREEIREALNSEGGWTKNALLKFKKVDSALREVGRYYGMAFCTYIASFIIFPPYIHMLNNLHHSRTASPSTR